MMGAFQEQDDIVSRAFLLYQFMRSCSNSATQTLCCSAKTESDDAISE
jgi:hypothetical protein